MVDMPDTPELDLDAYLARVGLREAPRVDVDGLTTLHQAHLTAIPFENLDVLLRRPIGLDLASLQAKLVATRRGGYCFEHNTLFQAVLRALGFTLEAHAARVRVGSTALRPRTHMLLRVELEGRAFLADVGFGGDGPVHPIPFAEGAEVELHGSVHRLAREDAAWVLQSRGPSGWQDLYAFTLEPQHAVDFEMANHFTSTWPRSPFRARLTAQRSWIDRRLILRDRELETREGASSRVEPIRDPDHLLKVLAEGFGLDFPPGTRFPLPEF